MTPEAKKALSSTVRGLRQRLLEDLQLATETAYRLSVRPQDTGLGEAARRKRRRLENWLNEQLRAQIVSGWRRRRDDFLREAEQQAVYTLLNRLVILQLMEEPGPSGQPLRKPALIRGLSAWAVLQRPSPAGAWPWSGVRSADAASPLQPSRFGCPASAIRCSEPWW